MRTFKTQKTILMDNVSFHHSKSITEYIERKGKSVVFTVPATGYVVLLLRSNIPELNPIENAFSIMKRYVRSRCPRNVEESVQYMLEGIELITATKCKNMFLKSMGLTTSTIDRDPCSC